MNLDHNIRFATPLARARRWACSLGIVALLTGLIAAPAIAGTYDGAMGRTTYVVMTGDVNGDGQNDVLLKAVPKILMISLDDDLTVPIPIPAPSPTFALISTSYGNYTLVINPSADVLASTAWKAATQQVTFTGPSGATAGSVTITAASSDQASFVVSMAGDTGVLQLTSTTPPAVDPAPQTPSLPAPIAVNITPPHLTNPDAGSLPGNLGVSPSGAATYGIPIVVPPGTAGLQPSLSLNYSSSGTNGTVGLGWSLSGLSSIHRCGQTIAQDGLNARISFDLADRLCLDGQRLVLVNLAMSDANYWADGAEFRTEVDSFARITAQVTNGKRSFKVESKDGTVMTYGSTASSYVLPVIQPINSGTTAVQPTAKSGAQSWALDRTEDRSHNFISFEYDQSLVTGEHKPTFIRYGGVGLAPHAAVQFIYEDRPDAWKRYIDETRNDLRLRIAHIKTFVGNDLADVVGGGTIVRDYTLQYDTSPTSGRSLLASVQACARNPQSTSMECLPKTTFDWGKPDPAKTAGFTSKGMVTGAPILTISGSGLNHSDFFAFNDFENHGFTDVLEKRVALGNPGGGALSESGNPIPYGTLRTQYRYFHNNGNGFTEYKYQIDTGEAFVVLSTGDFDGNGVADILVSTDNGPRICLSPMGRGLPLGAAGTTISFHCDMSRPAFGRNSPLGQPYVLDVAGDGRSVHYSPIDIDGNATLYLQDKQVVDAQAPYSVLSYSFKDDGVPVRPEQAYVAFDQSVDFAGIGKTFDVRWTRTHFQKYEYYDGGTSKALVNQWENLTPQILMTGFDIPGLTSKRTGMQAFTYPTYPTPCLSSGCTAPYAFDDPLQSAGLSADFNGSGYNGLMFGFRENGNDTNGFYYKRADLTLCLSTGRALDCGVRTKYSGDQYSLMLAVGNFVGDGHPTALVEKQTYVTGHPTPTHQLQMCSVSGDDTTAAAGVDNNINCTPWPGISLPPRTDPTGVGDKVYFMDLQGTGRMQMVYYHSGSSDSSNVWHEDGRWELFESTDLARTGQALDRIYQVTNGVGVVDMVEYKDASSKDEQSIPLVKMTGTSTLTYPQRVTARVGKFASRLIKGNGAKPARTISYRYEDDATDVAGRGSLGFAKVTATDEQTQIVTITTHLQSWPYTGMVAGTVVQAATGTLSTTSSTYGLKRVVQTSGIATALPVLLKSSSERWDLGGQYMGKVVQTNTAGGDLAYDDWGNPVDSMATTTAGSDSFTTQTVNTYQPADLAHWMRPLPIRRDVKKTDAAQPASAVTRSVKYTYETDFTGHMKTEQVQPDDTSKSMLLTTSYDRNPFGLVKSKVVNWFNPQTGVDNVSTHLTGYDDKGRFATSSTVSATSTLNHVETRSYDNATGAATSLTSPNGLRTTWTNDGFGRLQVERGADMNETRSYHKQCQADCPAGAALIEVVEHFNGVNRITVPQIGYADNAGHVLRTQSWGFDGRVILNEQRYDDLGRPWEADQPRYDGATAFLAHRTSYDVLGRVIKLETLADTGATVAATTEYQGMTTALTNGKFQKRTDLHDVLGRVKTVTDAMAGVTSFEYDPWNNLTKTTDPRLNVITVSYDALGRKTALKDPDLGFIEYFVDAAGLTWKQINPVMRAKGWSSTMQYDLLGRMTSRLEPDLNSYWVFDTAAMGMGKLAEAYTGPAALKSYQRLHTYDSLGRPSLTTQMLRSGAYTSLPEFDPWGRLIRTTYRRGSDSAKVFDQRYNNYGYMERVERSGLVLWRASVQDAANRVLESALGNGLKQVRVYSNLTGLERDNQVMTATNAVRLHENYDYDVLGSVALRGQYWDLSGFTETFVYDDLNRLKSSQVSGQDKQLFDYFADGSIKTKTGVGTGDYIYPSQGATVGRPHAVQQITGMDGTYSYDDNGNLLAGGGRTAQWTTFDMPTTITKTAPASTSSFLYGPEHQRTTQTRSDGTVVDYAGAQEVETKGGLVTVKTYWPGGLGVEIDRPAAPTELDWTHLDRLGSPIAISDAVGNLREKLAYDAWGKRRTIDGIPVGGTAEPDSLDGVTDNKGFTGHEMLDQLDLVHMNGRVYDPLIGRFLSGDPLVGEPMNGQNYNRYSYVLNNPTNLTDPTGFDKAADAAEEAAKGQARKDARDACQGSAMMNCVGRVMNAAIAAVGEIGSNLTEYQSSHGTKTDGSGNTQADAKANGSANKDGGILQTIKKAIVGKDFSGNTYDQNSSLCQGGHSAGACSEAVSQGRPMHPDSPWAQNPDMAQSVKDMGKIAAVGGGLGVGAVALSTLTGNAIGVASASDIAGFVRVTSWAPVGTIPTLVEGRWVIQGTGTLFNFLRTGLAGPQFTLARGLFWPGYSLANSTTGLVAAGSVKLVTSPWFELVKIPFVQKMLGPQ